MHSSSALDYENSQVLAFVQASLGGISSNVRSINLQCVGDDIHLYYVLEQDSAEDIEEIDDVVFELSALQTKNIPSIYTHISISAEPLQPTPRVGRILFLRKES